MEDIQKLNKKGIPITIIGLPYVGKTTLVNWIKEGRFTRPKPTVGVNFEEIKISNINFSIFDISGQKSFRSTIWKSYVMTSVGIIFILDSSDRKQLEEASKWFWIMVDEWLQGNYSDKVIMFIANKADLQKAMNLEEIIEVLNLTKMSQYQNLSFQFFKTSFREAKNTEYAMKWFVSKVKQLIDIQKVTPNALLITDVNGNILHLFDPDNIVEDSKMFVGYLNALSGFTNELLGHDKFKVIKVDPYFYFICEEKDHVISIAVDNEQTLPEARRLAFLITEYFSTIKEKLNNEKLADFIESLLA